MRPSSRPSVAPASGAANTSRFFGHCWGRAAWTAATSQPRRAGRLAALAAGAGLAGPSGLTGLARLSKPAHRARRDQRMARYPRGSGWSPRVHGREVAVSERVVAIWRLHLVLEEIEGGWVAWMVAGPVVHERHPVRVDV